MIYLWQLFRTKGHVHSGWSIRVYFDRHVLNWSVPKMVNLRVKTDFNRTLKLWWQMTLHIDRSLYALAKMAFPYFSDRPLDVNDVQVWLKIDHFGLPTVHFDDNLAENFLHNKFYIRIRFVKLWLNPKFKWNDPKTKYHIIVNVMDTQSPLRHGHEYRVIELKLYAIRFLKIFLNCRWRYTAYPCQ